MLQLTDVKAQNENIGLFKLDKFVSILTTFFNLILLIKVSKNEITTNFPKVNPIEIQNTKSCS